MTENGGMAQIDQIPSDLTIELDGDLSPDRFMAATRAFFSCVQEIARAVAPEGEVPQWIVRTRAGSHLIGLDPAPGAAARTIKAVYDHARQGLDQLAEGAAGENSVNQFLPDAAIRHLKTLSEMTERPKRNPIVVRIWIEKKPKAIGHQVAKSILESWGSDYRDYGTVEGRLDAVQDRNNLLQIRIYDAAFQQAVICNLDDDMLSEAFGHFRKRVEISGVVHYRHNGTPISIEVENIERLPEDSDLPSLDAVRGILRLEQ